MNRITLHLEPLTPEVFAPYGDVIEVSADNKVIPINYGLTERHHDLATIDVNDGEGKAIVSIFKTQPITLPFNVKVMERHPLGSQAFINITNNPYVVVVAPAGEFNISKLKAFIAQPQQGVNYHKGTWHHYCLGLNEENQFLVIDRGGEGHNCDESLIPDDTEITIKQ